MKALNWFVTSLVMTLMFTLPFKSMTYSEEKAQAYCDKVVGAELERYTSVKPIVACIKWEHSEGWRGSGKIYLWWDQSTNQIQFQDKP